MTPTHKSKTLATWVALLGGPLGLHRFYLHGLRDVWGWLHVPPTLLGLMGVERALSLGQDDVIAWVLIPFGGLSVSAAMLCALIYGLMPDERWNERHNPEGEASSTGWGAILGVMLALLLGSGVLMATLAFSGQRFFEYQALQALPAQALPAASVP